MSAYDFIAHIFGLIYLISWSLSFYPQAIENYTRKNVKGLSIEYAILNPIAYFLYSVYTVVGRIDHNLGTGMVVIADVLFATHGFALTAVHLTQCLIYSRGSQNYMPKLWCLIFLGIEISVICFFFVLEVNGNRMPWLLQTQMLCGYGLVLTNISKYTGQFYFNQKRRSTVGFSIKLVFLDLIGSTFSLLQLIMDSLGQGESVVDGSAFNIVKCLLSCIGIAFDCGFILQHYCQYREKVIYDQKKHEYQFKRGKRDELKEKVQTKLEQLEQIELRESQNSNQSGGSSQQLLPINA